MEEVYNPIRDRITTDTLADFLKKLDRKYGTSTTYNALFNILATLLKNMDSKDKEAFLKNIQKVLDINGYDCIIIKREKERVVKEGL